MTELMSEAVPLSDISERTPMMLWRADPDEAAPVAQALAETYALDTCKTLPDPATIKPGDNGPEILLLHLTPARRIARALAGGTAPDAALGNWRQETEAILRLNRRDRRRVRVLDIVMACEHPQAFRKRFALPEGKGPAAPEGAAQDDLFLLMLAQRLLAGDTACRTLAAELEAVSINLTGKALADPIDPDRVLGAYRDIRGDREEAAKLRALSRTTQNELETQSARNAQLEARMAESDAARRRAESATELLQSQNRVMQNELESLARRRAEMEKRDAAIPALETGISEKEQSLKAADAMFRMMEARNSVLGAELARIRERLAESEQAQARNHAETSRLADELHHVYSSRSYRLTAPLRRIRAIFGRGPA